MTTPHDPRPTSRLSHPFWQGLFLMVLAFVVFRFALPYLPPLVGIKSAPVPATVLFQYMVIALAGVLIFVSDSEARWTLFKQPINAALVDPDKKLIRGSMLVLVPLLAGYLTWSKVRPSVEAGAPLRSIHPANPTSITVHGKSYTLEGLSSPFRAAGQDTVAALELGRKVYYQNCIFCHGDRFDGQGHYAQAFNPAPLSFVDNGTIAQLSEGYVFWRISKGGPGLPNEGTPWNSAMPAWENFLTTDEIWAVDMFIYNHTGWKPRVMNEGGGNNAR